MQYYLAIRKWGNPTFATTQEGLEGIMLNERVRERQILYDPTYNT